MVVHICNPSTRHNQEVGQEGQEFKVIMSSGPTQTKRDGEMAQQPRAHTVLVEDPSSVSSTHDGQLTTAHNFSFKGIRYLWPLRTHVCMYTNLHTDTNTLWNGKEGTLDGKEGRVKDGS